MKMLILVPLILFSTLFTTAQTKSVFIEDFTWTELQKAVSAGKTTAIIYTGSTEQNGPHMVLGKHNFVARYVAGQIAERLGNALVYPIIPFAPTGDPLKKTRHMKYPGSITVSFETFRAVVRELVISAISAGFTNITQMGDHGGQGQEILQKVAEDLDSRWSQKEVHIYYIRNLYFKSQEQVNAYLTKEKLPVGSHAGIPDTSELIFVDKNKKWIRKDTLASTNKKPVLTAIRVKPLPN